MDLNEYKELKIILSDLVSKQIISSVLSVLNILAAIASFVVGGYGLDNKSSILFLIAGIIFLASGCFLSDYYNEKEVEIRIVKKRLREAK